jgi:hypothetical protein
VKGGSVERFPATGQILVVRPYSKKVMHKRDNRTSFNILDETTLRYANRYFAFADPKLSVDLHNTKTVPAGSYTIFTVPTAGKWTLIVNKKTGEWGIPYKYESEELARVGMKVSMLSSPVENFIIVYEKSGSGCTMNLDWETTRASVDITAN